MMVEVNKGNRGDNQKERYVFSAFKFMQSLIFVCIVLVKLKTNKGKTLSRWESDVKCEAKQKEQLIYELNGCNPFVSH